MGWTSSRDTRQQLRLWFDTKEEAIAYAEREGIAYRVEEPHEMPLLLKELEEPHGDLTERAVERQSRRVVEDLTHAIEERLVLEDRVEKLLLRTEVVVEKALRRIELERDVVHRRRVEAFLREHLEARLQDLVALPLGAARANVLDLRHRLRASSSYPSV